MKIKVCGLKDTANILAVAGLNPDYVGFIRYDGSPRFSVELTGSTLAQLPLNVIKTGVFVNESEEVIDAAIVTYGFNAIQLHGDESPEFCRKFKGKVEVLKAFGIDNNFDFDQLDAYTDAVDFFLFDTKTTSYGGSGLTFDWTLLDRYQMDVPFFLSGGIGLDNLADIKNIKHKAFYGVDLNSRFETEPGIKDVEKLREAFNVLNRKI
jgi:phosphoribosylanthranilate isomerase